MPTLLLLGSVAAPVIGGIVGNIAAGGDQDKANAAQAAALQQILGVNAPTAAQLQVALQKQQVAGQLNPEREGTINQGPSALAGISTDPRLRDAQMSALSKLQQLGSQGLSDTDRMALGQINRQADISGQGARGAILQNMAARGVGGSGAELAAQLQASQSAADTANQRGLSVASQAQQNALNAIAQSGALGGQIQGQEFNQKAQQAQAADAIARFNAANAQNVLGSNVNRSNQAQLTNLQNKQAVMNANTGIANQQALYNSNVNQQAYQDQLEKAKAAAGGYANNAAYNQQQAQATRDMYSKIGSGVGSGLGTYGAYNAYNDRTKALNQNNYSNDSSTATNPDSMQSPEY